MAGSFVHRPFPSGRGGRVQRSCPCGGEFRLAPGTAFGVRCATCGRPATTISVGSATGSLLLGHEYAPPPFARAASRPESPRRTEVDVARLASRISGSRRSLPTAGQSARRARSVAAAVAGAADLAAVVRSAADGVVVVIGRVGDCRRWIAPALGRLHRRWPEAVPSIVIVTAAGLIGAAIAATHPL